MAEKPESENQMQELLLTPQEINEFQQKVGFVDKKNPLFHNIKGKFVTKINDWEKFGITIKEYKGFTYLNSMDRFKILKKKFLIERTSIDEQIDCLQEILNTKRFRYTDSFLGFIRLELEELYKGLEKTSPKSFEFKLNRFTINPKTIVQNSPYRILGQCDTITGRITINLSNIFRASRRKNIDFYKSVCETITHEKLHLILKAEQDAIATYKYDDVTKWIDKWWE